MAKRFETTPGGLERTEMSGLLAVRRAPRVWEHKKDQAEGFTYKQGAPPDLLRTTRGYDLRDPKNRSGNGNEPESYA